MSDNWTASPLSLAGQGDWAKWTVTLGSAEVDALNNASSDFSQVMLRYGLTAGADVNNDSWCVMVNDWISVIHNATFSPTTWTSAGRFVGIGHSGSGGYVFGLASLSGSSGAVASESAPPWVVGANVIRVLNLTNVQVDVDFLALCFGSALAGGVQDFAETVPAGFAAHVNGTAFGTITKAWFLYGSDATTGTATVGVIDLDKLCPVGASEYRATVHVHDGGVAASGDVGGTDSFSFVRSTLDGTGRAVLVGTGGALLPLTAIWYGGSDAIGPEAIVFPSWPLPWTGCGGWVLGSVGMRA